MQMKCGLATSFASAQPNRGMLIRHRRQLDSAHGFCAEFSGRQGQSRRIFAGVPECACHSCGVCESPRSLGDSVHSIIAHSVMVPPSPSVLSRKVDLRVHNPHMPCQCIVARKSLFLNTQCTANFLLAPVVNGVFVSCQVVRTRKNGVARLPGRWVDALALVGPRL